MNIVISIEKTLNVPQSLPKGRNAERIKAHNMAAGCAKSISSLSNRLDVKGKQFALEANNLNVIIKYLRATNETDTNIFIEHIAAALGVKVVETQIHKKLKGKSVYKDIVVDFANTKTLRTSNHNVNIERFRTATREKSVFLSLSMIFHIQTKTNQERQRSMYITKAV